MTAPYNPNEVFDRHRPELERLTVSLQTDAVTAYSLLASLYHAAKQRQAHGPPGPRRR